MQFRFCGSLCSPWSHGKVLFGCEPSWLTSRARPVRSRLSCDLVSVFAVHRAGVSGILDHIASRANREPLSPANRVHISKIRAVSTPPLTPPFYRMRAGWSIPVFPDMTNFDQLCPLSGIAGPPLGGTNHRLVFKPNPFS